MRSPNFRYLPGVDHLRGFAALLIVFYHSLQLVGLKLQGAAGVPAAGWPRARNPFSALILEGHTAVAFFMVLSGFIFTFGSLDKAIAYGGFLRNRLYRIYPLFVFLVVCGLCIYPQSYGFLGVAQVLLFQGSFLGVPKVGEYLTMAWAIAIEFQFYLVFPFLLRFLQRYGVRHLVGLWILCLVVRGMAYLETAAARDLAYWSILGRIDQFIVGMLCGVAYVRLPAVIRWLKYTAPLFAAGVLGWLTYFNHSGGWPVEGPQRILWPTAEAIVWGAFLVSYLAGAALIPGLLSRWLARLGSVSFSIYLLHMIVLSIVIRKDYLLKFAASADRNALLTGALIVVPLTVALSTLTYLMIEKPFLDLRRSYLRPMESEADSDQPLTRARLHQPSRFGR